ncbi:calcium uniporter protein, mitochondrial-like isoform X3 [Varroa destructor]|uniref:Calcium uniporter protein n=1 Tax=Varroa destructor TaxID=109461 RepID=A0A7M7JYV1_VARDE|nr:calcium uniporter protein, mitochondrial-like isoform X3 [Varroa destructor]
MIDSPLLYEDYGIEVVLYKQPKLARKPKSSTRALCTQPTKSDDSNFKKQNNLLSVSYLRGMPTIIVPLPSRGERCRFTLRPLGNTLQDLCDSVQSEDRGVDYMVAHTLDGCRISGTTSIESLFQEPFKLTLNKDTYTVEPPEITTIHGLQQTGGKDGYEKEVTSEHAESLADVKILVNRLYESLTVSEHQLEQERKILAKIEQIQGEMEPLEKLKNEIARSSQRRTTILGWMGLGLMSVQFGVLARLTWWEYSWDIMEPVTYFVTYGTSMAAYAYFMVTKQDYYLPDVRDREFLKAFWKGASKRGLQLSRYNELRDSLAECQEELRRLRDPLQKHLPLREICDDCVHHKELEERRRKDEF